MTKMMLSVALIVVIVLMQGTEADPAFSTVTATVSVPEDAAVGNTVYQIDTTATGEVTFTISDTAFEAAADGGVKVATALDHEKTPSYTLTITAKDTVTTAADTDFTNQLILTVTVTNVAPSFPTITPVSITDGLAAEEDVDTFKATDQATAEVKHSIACGNTNSDFAIDATSGTITVATGRTIDDARTACYTLVLHAADAGTPSMTATATLVVSVTGGDNAATSCVENSNPCGNSGATLLEVPLFVMLLWISSYILK